MKRLHPNAVWLFFFKNLTGYFFILVILLFYISKFYLELGAKPTEVVSIFLKPSLGFWFFIVTLTVVFVDYLQARLSYHFYKYDLTDTEFRSERGIFWKRYESIPYNRIQNIDIYRGPLSRLLGLSDLQIQTAGYGAVGGYGGGSEGRLPGITPKEAELIRNQIMNKIKPSYQNLIT